MNKSAEESKVTREFNDNGKLLEDIIETILRAEIEGEPYAS